MGTLRIHGTIDLNQFWPIGASDADTTKIKLLVNKDSFEYRTEGRVRFVLTKAFDGAISKGQGSKAIIKTSQRTGDRTITVRLQGVDAPELHYKAAALKRTLDVSDTERETFNKKNKERRQCFAETSTVALAKYLSQFQNRSGLITCTFETEAEAPFEVIDTYGRFVGNVRLDRELDINLWILENGWGFPTFYTSMMPEEINACLAAWQKGKTFKGRTSNAISKDASNFNWDLLYRMPKEVDGFEMGEDAGEALMPKLFRRQVSWMIAKKAGVISKSTSFQTFLKKTPDQLILLDEFLEDGIHAAKVYALHDFIEGNIFDRNPEELVFKEKPGTLVDEDGAKITEWY